MAEQPQSGRAPRAAAAGSRTRATRYRVCIGNLPASANVAQLQPFFHQWDSAQDIVVRPATGGSPASAFVIFKRRDDAVAATRALQGCLKLPGACTPATVKQARKFECLVPDGSNDTACGLHFSCVPPNTPEQDIRAIFGAVGEVESLVPSSNRQGHSCSSGLVTMATHADAVAAIATLHNRHTVVGASEPMRVMWADRRHVQSNARRTARTCEKSVPHSDRLPEGTAAQQPHDPLTASGDVTGMTFGGTATGQCSHGLVTTSANGPQRAKDTLNDPSVWQGSSDQMRLGTACSADRAGPQAPSCPAPLAQHHAAQPAPAPSMCRAAGPPECHDEVLRLVPHLALQPNRCLGDVTLSEALPVSVCGPGTHLSPGPSPTCSITALLPTVCAASPTWTHSASEELVGCVPESPCSARQSASCVDPPSPRPSAVVPHSAVQAVPLGCAPDAFKLFIGGIPKHLQVHDLLPVLQRAGPVVELLINTDRATGQSRGSALLWYRSSKSARAAIRMFNKKYVLPGQARDSGQRPLAVKPADAVHRRPAELAAYAHCAPAYPAFTLCAGHVVYMPIFVPRVGHGIAAAPGMAAVPGMAATHGTAATPGMPAAPGMAAVPGINTPVCTSNAELGPPSFERALTEAGSVGGGHQDKEVLSTWQNLEEAGQYCSRRTSSDGLVLSAMSSSSCSTPPLMENPVEKYDRSSLEQAACCAILVNQGSKDVSQRRLDTLYSCLY